MASTLRYAEHKLILSGDQESDLSRFIRFAKIGLPVIPRTASHLVYKYCELNDHNHNFNLLAKTVDKG